MASPPRRLPLDRVDPEMADILRTMYAGLIAFHDSCVARRRFVLPVKRRWSNKARITTPSPPSAVLDWEITHPGIPRPSLNRLPPELREMIWKNTYPPPRTLQVEVHACQILSRSANESGLYPQLQLVDLEERREWKDENPKDAPPPLAPVALFVCQESRIVAQKTYQIAFRPKTFKASPFASHLVVSQEMNVGLPTWVDFNNDVFVFNRVLQFFNDQCLPIGGIVPTVSSACGEEIEKIKHLALRCPLGKIRRPHHHVSRGFPTTFANKLSLFSKLTTLKVFNLSFQYGMSRNEILLQWDSFKYNTSLVPPPHTRAKGPRDLRQEVTTWLKACKGTILREQQQWKAEIPSVKVQWGPWGNEPVTTFYKDWDREGFLSIQNVRSHGDEFGYPIKGQAPVRDTRFL